MTAQLSGLEACGCLAGSIWIGKSPSSMAFSGIFRACIMCSALIGLCSALVQPVRVQTMLQMGSDSVVRAFARAALAQDDFLAGLLQGNQKSAGIVRCIHSRACNGAAANLRRCWSTSKSVQISILLRIGLSICSGTCGFHRLHDCLTQKAILYFGQISEIPANQQNLLRPWGFRGKEGSCGLAKASRTRK